MTVETDQVVSVLSVLTTLLAVGFMFGKARSEFATSGEVEELQQTVNSINTELRVVKHDVHGLQQTLSVVTQLADRMARMEENMLHIRAQIDRMANEKRI